jgi:hypothetical protein
LFVERGLVQGYYDSHDVYPPLTFAIIAAATKLSALTGASVHDWYKFTQIAFLVLSAGVMISLRYSYFAIVALVGCLVVNSVMFESADVFYTLPLLVAVIAFLRGKYAIFSSFFALACLTKWQPILAAPIFGLYFLTAKEFGAPMERFKKIALYCVLPALVALAPVALIFGPEFIAKLFTAGTAKVFFSGNAFNLNYVLAWVCGAFTHLVDLAPPISPEKILAFNPPAYLFAQNLPQSLWWLSKALFVGGVLCVLVGYLRSSKSRDETVYFGFLLVAAYFLLATEVHENHIHLGVVLLAPLFDANAHYRRVMIYTGVLLTTNLLLYFSAWPNGFYFLQFGVLIALLNSVTLGYLILTPLFRRRDAEPAPPLDAKLSG